MKIIDECLKDVCERWNLHNIQDFEENCTIWKFRQIWGSTALGFSGVGGQALTPATTIVIKYQKHAAVYFNGQHAYDLYTLGSKFKEAIMNEQMPSVKDLYRLMESPSIA
jgi:hypothetical protein